MNPGLFVFAALLVSGCGAGTSPDGGNTGKEPVGLSACAKSSDCIVVPQTCCGSCGAATRDDNRAVNADVAAKWQRNDCQGQACPACYRPRDPTLVATCSAGSCRVVDLYQHVAASCVANDECRLRTSACCECGGNTGVEGLISVSDASRYAELVCDPEQGCPECAPIYPIEPRPVCSDGHCEVDDPRLP